LIGDGKPPAIGVKFLRDGPGDAALVGQAEDDCVFCESLMRFVSVN